MFVFVFCGGGKQTALLNTQNKHKQSKRLGFAKFYVVDHNSSRPMLSGLMDYAQEGVLEYSYFTGVGWLLGFGCALMCACVCVFYGVVCLL